MPSSFFGISIAATGMSTYNAGLNTTAHNISNRDTAGYTRQTAVQSTKQAISLRTSYGMVGAGSEVTNIESSRSEYYDEKYRTSNSKYGKYDTESYYLKNMEDYFHSEDDKTGSITNSMNNFFASLEYLTTSPLDSTIRSEAVGYAGTLCYYVEQAAIQLQELQTEVNTQVEAAVREINSYAEQIASITKQINTIEAYGETANDLRDQRSYLIDKLSEICDVTVKEKIPEDGNGTKQYVVSISEGVLVDTTRYNTIQIKNIDHKTNINDADNLFELEWSNGQSFNMHSAILGGKLQGLFEIRDGNNEDNFSVTMTSYNVSDSDKGGKATVTLTTDEYSSDCATALAKLNIPAKDGILTIGGGEYRYDSFDVDVAADGTYKYTFVMTEALRASDETMFQGIISNPDMTRRQVEVGDPVAFRGIPYYMAQLNEFVRTFSAEFNQIQDKGYDYYGNNGEDLFVATNITSGDDYDMTEFLKRSDDEFYYLDGIKVVDANKWSDYQNKGYTFDPIAAEPGYYNLVNSSGKVVEKIFKPVDDKSIFKFTSETGGLNTVSYYTMTAMNFGASKKLTEDPKLLAASQEITDGAGGWEEAKNLNNMIALQTDQRVFKQGDPESFLNVLITASLGVDSQKIYKSSVNSENILNAIDNKRLSESGVDEDEEAQNLVTFRNLLNYQYRVLSVMNEVLDKLINGTAL